MLCPSQLPSRVTSYTMRNNSARSGPRPNPLEESIAPPPDRPPPNPAPAGRLRAWILARAGAARFALRAALSVGISLAIAEGLDMAQPTWALISAIVVSRASSGDAAKAGRDRILGTLLGAAAGVLIALGRPLGAPEAALIVAGVALLSFLAAIDRRFLAGPIALVIVLAGDASGLSSFDTALHRLTEVGLGAVVATGVALIPLKRPMGR